MTGLRYPINALVSFHYYRRVDVGQLVDGGLRLVGDSGAYSALTSGAAIDPQEYVDWCRRWQPRLAWCAGLDVIGDAEATWSNWQLMTGGGLEFVPTVHYGEQPQVMDRYVEAGVDFLGLGGMVGRKSEQARLLRWTVSLFRYARDRHPGVRFHGWGVTHPQLLNNLPWFSVDSSGWGAAYRYARLRLFDRNLGRHVNLSLMTGRPHDYRHAQLIRSYGVDPALIVASNPANRQLLTRLSAESYQRMEDHMRRRVTVTAPRWGINPRAGQPGPHLHLADTDPGAFRTLAGPHLHLALDGTARHHDAMLFHPTRPATPESP